MNPLDTHNARFNGKLYIIPSYYQIDDDGPHSLPVLVAYMENRIPIGPATEHSKAVTGESYIEFASGISDVFDAEEKLSFWMWEVFLRYLTEVAGKPTLYWRTKPELIVFDANDNFDLIEPSPGPPRMVRRIYMRYLISSTPVGGGGA